MKDDSDLLRDGELPRDPFADAVPVPVPGEPDGLTDVPTDETGYRPFPVDALPEPVRTFVAQSAAAIGCDPAYVALPALAGLAAAIGNQRRIVLKTSWVEPAILWSGIIGESGTHKSPALDAALAPLKKIQAAALAEYETEKRAYDEQVQQCAQADGRKQTKGAGAGRPLPAPPVARRYICADATIEALAVRLHQTPRGLLLCRDELAGWICSFDQYKSSRGGDAAQWLEVQRAGTMLIDRKGNGETIFVPQAAVSITGGIQPAVLRRALGEEHLENGLIARFLLAMPPRGRKQWSDADMPRETHDRLVEVYEALLNLGFSTDAEDTGGSIDVPLTLSGRKAWIAFYNRINAKLATLEGALAAAYAKLEGYAARLALVVHLIRFVTEDDRPESDLAVDERSIEAGVRLVGWFCAETTRIYGLLGIGQPANPEHNLRALVAAHGGSITVRELQRAGRTYRRGAAAARAALDELVQAGVGRWEANAPGQSGRPSERFVLVQDGGDKTPEVTPFPNAELRPGDSGDGDKTPARLYSLNGLSHCRGVF